MFHAKHDSGRGLTGVWRGANRSLARAKAHFARASGVLALAILAACSSPEDMAEKTGTAPHEAPAGPTPAALPTPVPAKVEFTDNDAKGEIKRDFSYSWPAEVSAIPELAARLTAERDKLLAEQKSDWEGALEDFAGEDCTACASLDFAKGWEVVANLPRYLSLSSDSYVYTGGAHGNYWSGALVWDREAGTAFDPKTMFRSQAALQDALGSAWCKGLKAERAKRIGEEYADDSFFPCPPIADLAVLVGSSDRKSFNRVGLIAAPYVAGSYAEGSYELTFPVTPKVLAAVKPEFKAAFALGK
jgi:hypothetical protein